jgi:DNA repair protein RecO (recombination protein O)
MIKKYEGIIISTVDYKENSKIVNILTKNDGLIGVFAKGSKRLKSNISSTSSILTYGIFHTNSINKGMPNLIEVDIINSFKNIRKDLLKTNYAVFLLELSGQVYRHDNNNNIYELLISGLIKINAGYDASIICSIIELKLLDNLGIKPIIDKCVNCGNTNGIITISSYKGGYLCKNCTKSEKIFNIKTLKLIKMFYYVDINKISKLEISTNIKKEICMFIDEYYDRYAGLYLKSKNFLNEYANLNSDIN